MDALFMSYCLATRAAFEGHRRGIIEASAVQHLLDMADKTKWPRLSQAARDVVRDCGCGHMLGERRVAARGRE